MQQCPFKSDRAKIKRHRFQLPREVEQQEWVQEWLAKRGGKGGGGSGGKSGGGKGGGAGKGGGKQKKGTAEPKSKASKGKKRKAGDDVAVAANQSNIDALETAEEELTIDEVGGMKVAELKVCLTSLHPPFNFFFFCVLWFVFCVLCFVFCVSLLSTIHPFADVVRNSDDVT